MKKLNIVLLLLCLLIAANIAQAQSNPTVEIVLSQPTARQGDLVTADVYVRGAVNIAGADVGITVDDQCLKIVDRQAGSLLPSGADGGSYSPFAELHDHETRLAVAITDRTKYASKDGIFFETHLEVTCAQGTASLSVSFAEFSAYKDPSAANIELVGYTLTAKTVNTINAHLGVSPDGGATPEVTATVVPAQTLEATVTVVPTSTPVAPLTPVVENTSQNQIVLIVALGIMGLAVVGFIALVVVERRRRKR